MNSSVAMMTLADTAWNVRSVSSLTAHLGSGEASRRSRTSTSRCHATVPANQSRSSSLLSPEAPYTVAASKRSNPSGQAGDARSRGARLERVRHQASIDSSRPPGARASAASTITR